ncbi:endo alpha-1,4 polygalactosaminidase [Streptomyces sp. NP160]|uniref:endo alpha-1,4 polygalactosaminidase n=1 Tax=Streptomyces sp. NP160 TaxID=2586637 RepID=UPI0011191248|nr:endo alpha-1,4 polygalactosaminidase [Streptomyces sp. NP160]TNM67084.1 endo alpha-1,4 polygalactosaminidase [Streptomyces sp. NP160]
MLVSRAAAGAAACAGVVALVLAGCSAGGPEPAPHTWSPPPTGAAFDYQLGGAYEPAAGVTVVARDRTAQPAGLGYDICYVNGFQTQPAESGAFAAAHPDLVVQTDDGPLADPGWPDELLLDTSTAAKRSALLDVVGPWIRGCAASGFDAVEVDNLDSWTRSQGHLTADDNAALAVEYARVAHGAGLAVAQKNTAELAGRLRAAGYDFAVAESCEVYDECTAYTDQYPVVLDVEYTDELGADGFAEACSRGGSSSRLVRVLRDHDLLTPDDEGHAHAACPASAA